MNWIFVCKSKVFTQITLFRLLQRPIAWETRHFSHSFPRHLRQTESITSLLAYQFRTEFILMPINQIFPEALFPMLNTRDFNVFNEDELQIIYIICMASGGRTISIKQQIEQFNLLKIVHSLTEVNGQKIRVCNSHSSFPLFHIPLSEKKKKIRLFTQKMPLSSVCNIIRSMFYVGDVTKWRQLMNKN